MIAFNKFTRLLLAALIALSANACSKDKKSPKNAADASQTAAQNAQNAQDNTPSSSFLVDRPSGPVKLGNKIGRTVYSQEAVEAVDRIAPDIENALRRADSGDLSGAINKLNDAAKKEPKAFLAHYNLGILYERTNDKTNAQAAYENALSAEPNFSPALLQIVRLLIRSQNTNAANTAVNRYIIGNPDAFQHNYAKLEVLIAQNQFDDAISLSRQLLKKDEANPRLRYYIALAEFERKRYRLAEFTIGESLDIDPNDAEAIFLRARIHDALSTEDVSLVPGIAADLDRVLDLNPDHYEALWMRGIIYYEASNYTKAEEFFRKMIALNPTVSGGYINLANTLKTLNRGPEAEQLLLKARELDPNNGLVYFALGTLYLNTEVIKMPGIKDMDRLKNAKQQFETAQQKWSSPDDKNLAKGYIQTANDAIETLQAMLDAEALFNTSSSSTVDDSSLKVD